jgi:hypothetical protein
MDTKFTYVRDGQTIFCEELIVLHSWIAQSQSGVDLSTEAKKILGQNIWPSRFAESLKERLGVEFSPTEAYLLACAIVKKMEKLTEGFMIGLQ